MEKWMASLSDVSVDPGNVIARGLPWGGLHEALTGEKLAPGLIFDPPSAYLTVADLASDTAQQAELRPWAELLYNGTFSSRTLKALPANFEVSTYWLHRLRESVRIHGDTWLHQLFLGTIAMERGNAVEARTHYLRSMSLRPSAHAARGLALLSIPTPAWNYYRESWKLAVSADERDPIKPQLLAALVREIIEFALATSRQDLHVFLEQLDPDADYSRTDPVLYAKARQALNIERDWNLTMGIIENNCWAHYVGGGFVEKNGGGGAGNSLQQLYWQAAYQRHSQLHKRGQPLTQAEMHFVRVKSPLPRSIMGPGPAPPKQKASLQHTWV
eukprot:TRINITY_DN23963_c0_g1_i1.p2 TRINITY_DN23963_c0_g1~~TRINITY_DN23963_c0_g1_i1.p2  ORF type:complete len:329 (+),score=44.96 TRINITY_DN23963_c0_g1_i1:1630-2616(+)